MQSVRARLMDATRVQTTHEGVAVEAWPDVYVLGCIDRPVPSYSQQVRALILGAAQMRAIFCRRHWFLLGTAGARHLARRTARSPYEWRCHRGESAAYWWTSRDVNIEF